MHLLHFFSGIKKNTWRGKTARGFSLLELLVVLSIAIIITTVVLINYPQLGASNALNISVQETVQAIREAQLYGTSVKNSAGTSFPAYGIYIGNNSNPGSPPNYPETITIFADVDGNGVFNTGDTIDRTLTIDPPNHVHTICQGVGNEAPFFYGYDCPISTPIMREVSLVFKRPNPEPVISATTTDSSGVNNIKILKIVIQGPTGENRSIFVTKFGQISVGALEVPPGAK